MSKEIFGCPCCSGAFGSIFAAAKNGVSRKPVSRRMFIAGAAVGMVGAGPARAYATDIPGGVFTDGPILTINEDEAFQTTIFTGTILTVDKNFSEAEAIAVRDNKIVAVGTIEQVRAAAGNNVTTVDLAGKVMLPGFVDPHMHVLAGSVAAQIMDYVGMERFATADEVLDHLKARAKETAPDEWVLARNFDPALQSGLPALTFTELDAVSTELPVFVLHASGHFAYANSKAFEVAGIPADIKNPPGAEFVRDASGKLTGMMKNNVAYQQVILKYSGLARVNPVEALIGLIDSWSHLGLTTVSELSLGGLTQSPADVEILTAAAATGRLKARIRAYPFYTLGAETWDAAGVAPGQGDAMMRIVGYKLVADGANQGYTGLQREPYLNTDNRGIAYIPADELKAMSIDRSGKGWPLAIHGNGDAAIDNVINAYEGVRSAGMDPKQLRGRIEHCTVLQDDQIPRIQSLGVSPSFLIGHVYYWGIAFRDTVFGPEKAQKLGRCRSVQLADIRFSLHSDFPVTDPNPLHMMEMAVTRKTWKEPDFVLNANERISVESAIRAVTSEPAWQLYSEHEVGSLESGKFADFVILEQDPRKVDPDTLKTITVMETWMNGKQVYKA